MTRPQKRAPLDPERGRGVAAHLRSLGAKKVLIRAATQGYITELASRDRSWHLGDLDHIGAPKACDDCGFHARGLVARSISGRIGSSLIRTPVAW